MASEENNKSYEEFPGLEKFLKVGIYFLAIFFVALVVIKLNYPWLFDYFDFLNKPVF